jgi:Protein of unknown function (DUF2842)
MTRPPVDFAGLGGGALSRYTMAMSMRLRKLIGSAALILFSLAYYAFAISIAIVRLPGLATPWHLLFYCLTVVIWFIPCAMLIRWMLAPR